MGEYACMEGLKCSRSGDGPGPVDECPVAGDHGPVLSLEEVAGDADPDAFCPSERRWRRFLVVRVSLGGEDEPEAEGIDGVVGVVSSSVREKSSSDDTPVGAESGPPFNVPKGRFFHVTYYKVTCEAIVSWPNAIHRCHHSLLSNPECAWVDAGDHHPAPCRRCCESASSWASRRVCWGSMCWWNGTGITTSTIPGFILWHLCWYGIAGE